MEIEGKVAVVTGAASGIGRAMSVALAKEGAKIVIADRNEEGMAEVAEEIRRAGRRALMVRTDVSKLEDIRNLFERAVSEMGRVDILVNNAGVHMMGDVEKTPIEDWRWIIDINLWSVIYGIHVFLPHMMARGSGYIVNTASSAGLAGSLDASIPYTTSKFAVVGLSEGLAVYLKEKGIGVTVVCPGLVNTNILDGQRFVPAGDGLDASREALVASLWQSARNGTLKDLIGPDADADIAALAEVASPAEVAAAAVRAVRDERFLVVVPEVLMNLVRRRSDDTEAYIRARAQSRARQEEMFDAIVDGLAQAKNPPV